MPMGSANSAVLIRAPSPLAILVDALDDSQHHRRNESPPKRDELFGVVGGRRGVDEQVISAGGARTGGRSAEMNAADLCSARHGCLGAVARDEQAGRCYLSPGAARPHATAESSQRRQPSSFSRLRLRIYVYGDEEGVPDGRAAERRRRRPEAKQEQKAARGGEMCGGGGGSGERGTVDAVGGRRYQSERIAAAPATNRTRRNRAQRRRLSARETPKKRGRCVSALPSKWSSRRDSHETRKKTAPTKKSRTVAISFGGAQ
uniref:Uncharacterized protein n=1 Tax=Plectus sambesii TaxID=2011161 RepID=A0A914XG74_9BILA